jgi:hypothetical protein
MSKEVITAGLLGTVFANVGVALVVGTALVVYVAARLAETVLTPPVATD